MLNRETSRMTSVPGRARGSDPSHTHTGLAKWALSARITAFVFGVGPSSSVFGRAVVSTRQSSADTEAPLAIAGPRGVVDRTRHSAAWEDVPHSWAMFFPDWGRAPAAAASRSVDADVNRRSDFIVV